MEDIETIRSHAHRNLNSIFPVRKLGICFLLTAGLLGPASSVQAGSYIFAGESNGVDLITHPTGYTGTGGQLSLNVCIVPGSPNEVVMEQSVRNMIAVYNQLLPTTGNIRTGLISGGQIDFESVALHELGHCIGKAHVNLASESGLGEPDRNYTKSTDGAGAYDLGIGVDGVRGSSDDLRGDDVNLHWYRTANNNPFTIDYSTVDSTTYARDTASLPAGHNFATNGDRTVATSLLNTPRTEAVMQQLSFSGELQRTLTPDGVATMQLAMSGLDELAGTSDDYTYQLNFATSSCDINVSFDNTQTGFAVCQTGGSFVGSHVRITSANIYFNTGFSWVFNTVNPCSETFALTQNKWTQISLPCSVGISTGNTVADVVGDDLSGTYLVNWVVYERDAATNTNVRLELTSEMSTGKGYWIFTNQSGQVIDVEGQYNGSPDTALRGAGGGRANLVGHPFDFSVDWEDVQIVDGADVQTLAAAVSDGDLSETFHIWNGNAYDAFDATTPGMIGTLAKFDGVWVKAFKDSIYLRVPSVDAGSPSPPAGEFALQSEDTSDNKPAKPAKTDDESWFVRLIVESGDSIDAGNVLGQLPDSVDGKDKHDLEELVPFGSSFLTIVFPHEDWEGDAWNYTSDFHATTAKPQGEWLFAVYASEEFTEASLRLEGPADILRKGQLRDLETGKRVKYLKGDYHFNLSPGMHYFSFRVGRG